MSKITQSAPDLNPNHYKTNRIYANPEKALIARDMLERYVGCDADQISKQILLTNFSYYIDRFEETCEGERFKGSAMEIVNSKKYDVSIINFNIGSPNAALIIELLSSIDPTAVVFLGMCGGLHPSLNKGDFILPTAGIRDDSVSKHFLPIQVPALPTFKIQKFLSQVLVENGLDYRTGTVHTTDYRFWEFNNKFKNILNEERALGIDMETATLFTTGFAAKVPIGALLLVSDMPLKKGGIKTKASATGVFKDFTKSHIDLGITAIRQIKDRGEHIRHYRW